MNVITVDCSLGSSRFHPWRSGQSSGRQCNTRLVSTHWVSFLNMGQIVFIVLWIIMITISRKRVWENEGRVKPWNYVHISRGFWLKREKRIIWFMHYYNYIVWKVYVIPRLSLANQIQNNLEFYSQLTIYHIGLHQVHVCRNYNTCRFFCRPCRLLTIVSIARSPYQVSCQ